MSLDNQSQPLPAESYPAYGPAVFAAPVKPKPRLDTITHLFESDDGLWYQAMVVEIGYSMIREHEPITGKWNWVYSYEPRILKVNYIIDGPCGYGDSMETRTPRPLTINGWMKRAEWILKTNFKEVDAAIRAGV